MIHEPWFAPRKLEMHDRLYAVMEGLRGMNFPMNPPRGCQQNIRRRGRTVLGRGGERAEDFPQAMILVEPLSKLKK